MPERSRNGFEINDEALVNGSACIQLIAGSSATPMTMQLVAEFETVKVSLDSSARIAEFVLNSAAA